MEKIAQKSCVDFIEVLASKAAVPGGGGAAALAGQRAYPRLEPFGWGAL